MRDIVPELLEQIEEDFRKEFEKSTVVLEILNKIKNKTASYKEANLFAVELGELLSKALRKNINQSMLPDGKMYYNIAERILGKTLSNNYNIISKTSANIQTILNQSAGLNIKGLEAELNNNRIEGLVEKIVSGEQFDDVAWVLGEPVVNFGQSVVNDVIKTNVNFHHKLGLTPKIVRKTTGHCCEWCENLAGTYNYPDEVPDDVYRVHRFCRCTVDYKTSAGKAKDIHTKEWLDKESKQKRDERIKKQGHQNPRKAKEEERRKKRKLKSFSKKLNTGKQKNHIYGTNEFKQRTKQSIEPSYFDNTLEEVEKYGMELIGTGKLLEDGDGNLKEKVGNHPKLNSYVVNNKNGMKVKTNRNVIRYHKDKGWHIYPDYPKKE